jgi:cytochrome c556
MSRFYALVGGLAVAVLVLGGAKADDKDKEKLPDIGEIMEKAHGKEGLRATITQEIKAKEWDKAVKTASEWEKLADALARNKPEKGTAESWKKQTGTYNKTLKTLVAAVKAKDASKAKGALGKIGSSCKTCHSLHKGE